MFSLIFLASAALADDPQSEPLGLEVIDEAMLDRLCNAKGGIAGEFYTIQGPADGQPRDIAGFSSWELSENVGPFTRYALWAYGPDFVVHTLRYYGRRHPSFTSYELYHHVSPLAEKAGWKEVEDFEFGAAVNWYKTVESDGRQFELQLAVDGGMLSTSLYCSNRTLRMAVEAELLEKPPGQE